ncbi:MAG: M20/M25/M40 family metallo-hydrolase [Candidatus Thermoplasmatota archaeon]
MNKKIIGIFIVMLMISSAMTTIMFSEKGPVEASEEPQNPGMNLDYEYVWEQVQKFGNVIRDADYPDDIKKGREWATAGENYTIDQILEPALNGTDKPCGLTNYTKLSIDYISGPNGLDPDGNPKQYSSKIVIKDYNLTIHNGDETIYIPDNELFPLGVGCIPNFSVNPIEYLNHTFEFNETKIIVKDISVWDYIQDHLNFSCTLLNTYDTIIGPVVFLDTVDPVPENHDCVFILNEELASEEKLNNISDAMGCILIENSTKEYTFENGSQYNFTIAKLNGTDNNFSSILEEIQNDSVYLVDNIQDNTTLVFSNYSNESCFNDDGDWVAVFHLNQEKNFGSRPFWRNIIAWWLYPKCCDCTGAIMCNYVNDTHYMSHTVRDGSWFKGKDLPLLDNYLGTYSNRFPMPILSVNGSLWDYFSNNENSITVDGFINQTYRQQNSNTPGVISHNVVAYRNITHSPENAIVVLSNRIDGHWGETPGDSGVGGAILLGIAKYFHDNNITPKYNLTFLFTTGEEYGMRGAQHFVDSHPIGTDPDQYNFKYIIGFDQLGFNYTITEGGRHCLQPHTNNEYIADIIRVIENQTKYEERTAYDFNINNSASRGAEDYVWNTTGVDTILFEKGEDWDGHHQVGENFSEGDSLKYIDRDDVNVTFEFAWNVTKYFTVNPNCWFDNISFTAFDSLNDGDTLNDSIRTNFTIHSILPSDKIRVELDLGCEINGEQVVILNTGNADYLLTSRSQNESYVFTIPDDVDTGNYSVSFKLYNSTGRINRIVYGSPGSYHNDTSSASNWYRLYHPLGYTKVGDFSQSVDDRICGSVFTANEDGRADNITVYIDQNFVETTHYKCMLYRANDSVLIGTTTENWSSLGGETTSPWWAVFNFTGTKPQLVKGTQYVITCWGNSTYSSVSYTDSNISGTGRYDHQSYGTPPDPADFTNEPRYYSLYCSYTPDATGPQITDVTANPDTLGFGYTVTITANVTDTGSSIDLVTVRISEPGGGQSNNTMTHVSGNLYQYVFPNTWRAGPYNYTIWAQDNETNSNTSATSQFQVTADATISIATLQDTYSGEDYINITDPPNPPENLTLVTRGLTWDNYYNAVTGENILEVTTGPINYQEDNGTWMPINTSMNQLASDHPAYVYGYRTGNNQGLYGVYFKANAQQEWPVAFTYNRSDEPTIHAVRSKLLGVGYVDPGSNWSYASLQGVQNSQGQTNNYSITYENVFTGADATWSYGNTGIKEEITLSNTTRAVLQSHPPSQYGLNNNSSYLAFITKLDHPNLHFANTTGVLPENVTITDTGVDLRDTLGQFKCALPLGEAYELNNESMRQKLTYRIIHMNGSTYLLSGLKVPDLSAMTFPVVIDPSMTIYSAASDGYLFNSSFTYDTVQTTTNGNVNTSASFLFIGQRKEPGFPSLYRIYRGYVLFNTSLLPSNAHLDNATLSLYKKDDYSTTDFDLTIQNGQPTSPHDPLQTGDYNKNHYSGDGGSLNTSGFTTGYNTITLQNLSWINTTGTTKFCLRSSNDITAKAPSGNEYVTVHSNEILEPGYPRN